MTLALIIQVIWGNVIHNISRPPGGRPWYRQAHRIFGPTIFTLALTNAIIGVIDHGTIPIWVIIIGIIHLVVVGLVFTKAEIWFHRTEGEWGQVETDEALSSRAVSRPEGLETKASAARDLPGEAVKVPGAVPKVGGTDK